MKYELNKNNNLWEDIKYTNNLLKLIKKTKT